MKLAEVLLVAGKELRETLRDRRTLAVMVLFPLVVYPLVSLATVQVLSARIGRTDRTPARVAVAGQRAIADELRARLSERSRDGNPDFTLSPATTPATGEEIRAGRLDAVVALQAAAAAGAAPVARILFDETQERSRTARDRLEEALAARAESACAAAYVIKSEGVAPKTAMGGYLLSRVLPLIIVVMVLVGAFHPAIDITAGERERSTLETTLSAPIARAALMTGKVVAVGTLAALSGLLNLASMSITVLEGAKLVGAGADVSLPWLNAGAAALLVIPPAAFLFASVMVALGALARSFKEAQTLLTPVYFLCMAPSLLAALGDFELGGVGAFLPGVGVTLLARDVIAGRASTSLTVVVFASSIAYGAAALALACRLYDSERLLGADDAGLGLRAWLRHLIIGPKRARAATATAGAPPPPRDEAPTAGQALALYAFGWLVLLAFAPVQKWNLHVGLVLFQWVGLFGLTVLFARGSGGSLASVLRLRRPEPAAVVGALLIGSSAWLVLGLLADWVMPPPKELIEKLRPVVTPAKGTLGFALALLITAVTPAICEEALFRGPILRGLRTRLSGVGAAVLTGLLFGLFHGSVWRFIPTAALGVALSAIALAADSIIPAMVAHFANNAILIALANAGMDESSSGTLSVRDRLVFIAIGAVGSTAGAALLARSARRTRRVSGLARNDAADHRM